MDRIERPLLSHCRFVPRDLPAPDAAAYVTRSFAEASYRYTVRISADSAELVIQYIAAITALGAAFTLDGPTEITDRLRALARRLPV